MSDFDVDALFAALDDRRRAEGLSWAQTARAVSDLFCDTPTGTISTSTFTGLRDRSWVEGDGVLQMLRWLGRSPESFIAGSVIDAPLPAVPTNRILRFDVPRIYDLLNARRAERDMPWTAVASEIEGFSVASLTRMRKGGRTGFPQVGRLARWLGCPIADLTRAATR